jgi:hypothetical protein
VTGTSFTVCETGKVPHESYADAVEAAKKINATRASQDRGSLNDQAWQPYRCHECGMWHVGRSFR